MVVWIVRHGNYNDPVDTDLGIFSTERKAEQFVQLLPCRGECGPAWFECVDIEEYLVDVEKIGGD